MHAAPKPAPATPSIDLAPFLAGEPAAMHRVAGQVAAACRDVGFFTVSGHGVPDAVIRRVIDLGFDFFALPRAVKDRWHPTGPARQRGYHGYATRGLSYTLGQDGPKDLRESVFLGPIDDHRAHYAHLPDAAGVYAPNLIPGEPDGFAEALAAMYRAFERLAADIMRVFAAALGLPDDHFAPMIDRHFSIMSTHHYPALTEPPLPGQLRTGAHTDYGSVTILAMTDARGGLEARAADGTWLPVRPAAGELVVNLGDMMQRWTNDRWVSTLHRVATPALNDAGSRRLSIGYFMHPNYDAEIACIPSCLAPGAAPRHPAITAGEHIRRKIEQSHDGVGAGTSRPA